MPDLVVLLFLISTTVPSLETTQFPPESPEGWKTLKSFALVYEIVGPEERWGRWEDELCFVHRHYHELMGAPPLCDVHRIPSSAFAYQNLRFVQEYRIRLEERWLAASSWQKPWFDDALMEADILERVYASILSAKDSKLWAFKRRALQELRMILGDEDYYQGNWPSSAPLHRFQWVP